MDGRIYKSFYILLNNSNMLGYMKTVRIRPHHLSQLYKYVHEYTENDKAFYRGTDESGYFYDRAFKLFDKILDKSVKKIRIVTGIDSVCSFCPERDTYVGGVRVGYPKECLKPEDSRILTRSGLEVGKDYSPQFVLERLRLLKKKDE